MTARKIFSRPSAREIRWLCYLAVLLAAATWRFWPRPWHPTQTVMTAHHKIFSTATPPQVADTAHALELLYLAYSNQLGAASGWRHSHPLLQVQLYKNRDELRRVNPGLGWAEAFYQEPYCRAYFSDAEINPYHWMLHEATHQLNHEVAHLQLAKWLEEGVADYFGSSRLTVGALLTGQVDANTYPVWWIDDLATSTNLAENIRNGSVIPLRAIITNRGGPSMDQEFNLYYLHWWTLTYFIFESEKYRDRALRLVQSGGDLESFEKIIGPVDGVQAEWHDFVRRLKAALAGKDPDFFRQRAPRPF